MQTRRRFFAAVTAAVASVVTLRFLRKSSKGIFGGERGVRLNNFAEDDVVVPHLVVSESTAEAMLDLVEKGHWTEANLSRWAENVYVYAKLANPEPFAQWRARRVLLVCANRIYQNTKAASKRGTLTLGNPRDHRIARFLSVPTRPVRRRGGIV